MFRVNSIYTSFWSQVVYSGPPLPALPKTVEKIASFRHLRLGWHYGEGGPIDESVIYAAAGFFWQFFLRGFNDADAFPGAHGEVMVTAYEGDHYVEVIAETDGSVSVAYEFKDEEMCVSERISPAEATKVLTELVGIIWSTSDFCTLINSIPTYNKTVLRAWLSEVRLGDTRAR